MSAFTARTESTKKQLFSICLYRQQLEKQHEEKEYMPQGKEKEKEKQTFY